MQATKRANLFILKFSKRVFCNKLQAVIHHKETSELNLPLQYLLGIYIFLKKIYEKKKKNHPKICGKARRAKIYVNVMYNEFQYGIEYRSCLRLSKVVHL